MRAIIVEIRNDKAAAMSSDGTIQLVPNRAYTIGQTVSIYNKRKKNLRRLMTWAACISVLCSIATVSVYAVYEPYSYISIDADSPVEYTLNRFNQVLSVRAINQGSDKFANALHEELSPFSAFDTALEQTIAQCYKDGYLTGDDDDYMIISVAARSEKKSNHLKEEVSRQLGESFDPSAPPPPPTQIERVSFDEHKAAMENGISPGRMRMERKLSGNDRPSDAKLREKPLHELKQQLIDQLT